MVRAIVEIGKKREKYNRRVGGGTLLAYLSHFSRISTIGLANKAVIVFPPRGMSLLTFFFLLLTIVCDYKMSNYYYYVIIALMNKSLGDIIY